MKNLRLWMRLLHPKQYKELLAKEQESYNNEIVAYFLYYEVDFPAQVHRFLFSTDQEAREELTKYERVFGGYDRKPYWSIEPLTRKIMSTFSTEVVVDWRIGMDREAELRRVEDFYHRNGWSSPSRIRRS